MLQFFDLFDRGYDPQDAINWMKSNGYGTDPLWYPSPDKAVLGLGLGYLASLDGNGNVYVGPGAIWSVVIEAG